jgi:hypothetical protein
MFLSASSERILWSACQLKMNEMKETQRIKQTNSRTTPIETFLSRKEVELFLVSFFAGVDLVFDIG